MSKRTKTMGDLYEYIGSRIKESRYDYSKGLWSNFPTNTKI